MRRLWLLFAQTITVSLALWFVLVNLKPEWVAKAAGGVQSIRTTSSIVTLQEAPIGAIPSQGSYRDAAKRAMPSVVNIFTTKEAKRAKSPFSEDPLFKKFFGDRFGEEEKQSDTSRLGAFRGTN